ncbi:glyoxylate/hydroxypyruvate reductase A [Thiomonas sp. FB-Cd]|uniref:2-hydroxyacid dehydrogenase n=1 Tax=Thiomonas sp. FB-Cd TaxID=1158292 RepID=UPI0004DEEA53|nr:glyoxylate/hydroxypyruvate reductase A [Thiomonas sp. FB-Cd]
MKLAVWDPDEPFRRWRDALVQHASELGLAVEVIDATTEPDTQADFALVWKPPAHWLAGQLGLRAVFNLGAGVDAVLPLMRRALPGVPLIRLEDAGMGRQMADYVAEAVLHAWRRMPDYAALQSAQRWEPLVLPPRGSFHVGFLGLGQMGYAAARRIAAMDFPVLACTRSGQPRPTFEAPWPLYPFDRLDAFLAQTRVLVVLLPLTAQTTGLLDYAVLSHLPRGAHVVNAGRGAVIEQADLLDLLGSGHIASATLDVFATEPLPEGDALWRHPRVRITPHVAAQTLVGPAAAQVMRKIATIERGEAPSGAVDQRLGY